MNFEAAAARTKIRRSGSKTSTLEACSCLRQVYRGASLVSLSGGTLGAGVISRIRPQEEVEVSKVCGTEQLAASWNSTIVQNRTIAFAVGGQQ